MPNASTADLDLTKELRLRRWARQNYVSAENRSDEWHAVVVDEMKRRDGELAERPPVDRPQSGFVPLAPTEFRRVDEAHDTLGEPNMMQTANHPMNSVPRVATRGL